MENANNLSTNRSGNMNRGAKGVLLAIGAYIVTMGVAFLVALLAIIILMMGSGSCSTMAQALVVLWVIIAAVCLASVVVVAVITWKFVGGMAGRLAIVAVYGAVMLMSYVVLAFGLMVAFNC